ncbi:hypothetical protein [Vibrio sp. LaRot3]|nr:hypothetical protein [Vibrio sp. LaRot3]MDA0148623.1 hypothetical protein [Vibrio sp. LaRot3]
MKMLFMMVLGMLAISGCASVDETITVVDEGISSVADDLNRKVHGDLN